MAKPAQLPTWATDGGALLQNPGSSKQGEGWKVEIPVVEFQNWWQNLVGQWVDYFDTEVDAVKAIQGLYDAIIGPSGTHADFNAVMADMDGTILPVENVRIFVASPLTVTTTQIIDKPGVEIEFGPKASFAKGGSLVTGLQLDAYRIKVLKGRFLNFDEVGGKAIELTSSAKNCAISLNTFNNNTAEVEDNGQNNQIFGNLTEVV